MICPKVSISCSWVSRTRMGLLDSLTPSASHTQVAAHKTGPVAEQFVAFQDLLNIFSMFGEFPTLGIPPA